MTATQSNTSSSCDAQNGPAPGPPDISFIVAAHNTAPYVAAAVHSALAQADVAVEVIVVDDASTDATPGIVADIARSDGRVVLIRRPRQGGASVARNEAMRRARGAWMAILDADDLISPGRSRRLLDMALATSADIVADNFERFWVEGVSTGDTMLPRSDEPYSFFVDVASFLRGNAMFDRNARLGYIKPMFRSAFLRSSEIEHHEDILIGEDYHLCLSCLMAGARFLVTSEDFYKYRIRQGSLSWRIHRSHIDRLRVAHQDLDFETRYPGDPEIRAAATAYGRALDKAAALAQIIEDAKAGRSARAVMAAVAVPSLWPVMTRFALEAVKRRLTRAAA